MTRAALLRYFCALFQLAKHVKQLNLEEIYIEYQRLRHFAGL